jgi:phytol kinase
MSTNLFHLLLLSIFFLVLFGIAEFLYRILKVEAEYTRKLVHIGTGLLTMFFPLMFTHYFWVILICSSFIGILSLSLKFGFLPSINAIQRKSYGSISYPVIVILTFLFYYFKSPVGANQHYFFYLPILTMAFADPAAALFGRRFPYWKFSINNENKTPVGSVAFFIVATVVHLILLPHPNYFLLFLSVFLATLTEALSRKGLDNLLIPMSVMSVIYFHH